MKSRLIEIISRRDRLPDFMDRYNLVGLMCATEEQLLDYIGNVIGMNICFVMDCGWYDSDFGCTCPGMEKWYQCPLEPEPDWEEIIKEGNVNG